jgi:DNA-binding NtrC family response regulator
MVRWSLAQALEDAGYTVEQAVDVRSARELLREDVPDVVLTDFKLPDGTGMEIFQTVRQLAPRVPVVMITVHASIGGAVEAMKEGFYDYIRKPFDLEEIKQTVARALEAGRMREQLGRRSDQERKSFSVENIVSDSPAMKEVVQLIRRVALSEASTILLTGESGVGKGLIARALHFEGRDWERPFMHITCTAIPETLLESELFGHEKGAFTDARSQKKGLFELADNGTIFMDEIGDISLELQGKLLRALEEKKFRRVGGTRDISVSARIVAATNRELKEEVAAGRFRQDLYFRLKVIPIEIPPLRDRRDDLTPLANNFLQHFNGEFRKSFEGFDQRSLELMHEYGWPGNVRELRNAVERGALLGSGNVLLARDLPSEIRDGASPVADGDAALFDLPPGGVDFETVERDLVRQALERCSGNRTRAAQLLGMNRDQIRYRIDKFRLEEPQAS